MYPGEELVDVDGVPVLRWTGPGRRGPLVVFLPGIAHLARIAYGHPGATPGDFLAHHLAERDRPLLALSYPIDHPVFPTVHPELTVPTWTRAVAQLARSACDEADLPPEVVVVAWSAAGITVGALARACAEVDVELVCAVAVCATPPLSGLDPDWGPRFAAARRPDGLVGIGEIVPAFERQVAAQDERSGHRVFAGVEFAADVTGAFPVGMGGSDVRFDGQGYVVDPAQRLSESGALELAAMPLVGVVHHTSALDPHHALKDRGRWALSNAERLQRELDDQLGGRSLDGPHWDQAVELFGSLPQRLSRRVAGNHFCLVGSTAGEVVGAIEQLEDEVTAVRRQLAGIVDGAG